MGANSPCLSPLLILERSTSTAFLFLCSSLSFHLIPLSKLSSFLSSFFSHIALPSLSSDSLHQKSSHVLGDGVSSSATTQTQPYKSTNKVEFCAVLCFSLIFSLLFFTFCFAFSPFSLISLCIHLLGSLLHCTIIKDPQTSTHIPLLCASLLFILPYYMFLLHRSCCRLPYC